VGEIKGGGKGITAEKPGEAGEMIIEVIV